MQSPADAPNAFEAAWNEHDMEAFGRLFHEDASFVNRFGHYVRGVADIVALHAGIHSTIYRDSTLSTELVDVRLLGDATAVVHFWCRLATGAAHPAGAHSIDTLILAVMSRHANAWKFVAVENVTLADPRTGATVLRS